MARGSGVPKKNLPILGLSVSQMILPRLTHILNLEGYPDLLNEVVAKNVNHIFIAMNAHDEANSRMTLHTIGVVAEVVKFDDAGSLIWLRGKYRAPIISAKGPDSNKSYPTVTIGNLIEDELEEIFIERSGHYTVDPKFRDIIDGLMLNLKKSVGDLLGECTNFIDSDIEKLGEIYDYFDNLDFNRRDIIDELIWNIISAVPQIDSGMKQHFIETVSLLRRIAGCTALVEINLRSIRKAKKFKLASSGSGDTNPPSDPNTGDNQPDDPNMNTGNPELAEKYKKYLEIKKSIKNPAELSNFEGAVLRDFKRLQALEQGGNGGPELGMLITRLDFNLSLPWGKESPMKENFSEFEQIFESEHFGLGKVKEEVSDHVAVRRNNPDGKGRVLCFVGPPGVGKTSVCKSIANGLALPYMRISLGGVRDEADIRGHRLTYIGSLPGRIMSGMRNAGVKNPVFVLDEIDKLGKDGFRGNPEDALLEVLDPEQNHSFTDHYLEVPFDLSKVLFICTANTLSGIPIALRDRMDIIPFSGYTEEAKVQIAKNFLLKKVLNEVGLAQNGIDLRWEKDNPDDLLLKIIRGYTKESGVRDLERKLSKIARKIVKEDLKNPGYAKELIITEDLIEKIHGRPRYTKGRAQETEIGEAIGLLVDTVGGGDITYVQAKLSLKTGLMDKSISQTDEAENDLHKSTQRAITVAKSRLENRPAILKKLEKYLINVQVSDTFVPTGGPSAGITVAVAAYSELTQQVVEPFIAMTGAISLTGRVKAVGGIKEKVIAAANAGIKKLILPESNRKDYEEDVPESAKKKLENVYFVENIDQVLKIVFPDETISKPARNEDMPTGC